MLLPDGRSIFFVTDWIVITQIKFHTFKQKNALVFLNRLLIKFLVIDYIKTIVVIGPIFRTKTSPMIRLSDKNYFQMNLSKLITLLSFCFFCFISKGHEIDQLLQKLPQTSVEKEKIELWEQIINISIWQKSEKETKAYIDQLDQYSRERNNAYGVATADLLYAKYYERQQEMDKAKEYADNAYTYFYRHNNQLGMCKSLRQKGFNAFKISNIEQATEFAYKALDISTSINNKLQEGLCLGQVGLFVFGSQPEEGIKLHKQGFDLLIKTGAKREASITAVTLSTLYLNSGDDVKSQHYIDTFFILQQQFNDVGLLAEGKVNAALLAQTFGSQAKAEQLMEESGAYFSQIDSEVIQAKYLRIKSVFYRESNRYPQAIEAANKALAILESRQGLDNEKGMLQYSLFVCYKALKQYEPAIAAYEQAVNHEFAIYDEQTQLGIADMKEKYETEKKELENQQLKKANEVSQLKLKNNSYVFIGLLLLSLFIVVVSLLIFRNSKVRAREKNLQLQQRLLRSQMNPHFMFNALSSIQHYMYANDGDKAGDFLSSFARLSRGILDHSQVEVIPLEKEIQWLNDYVKLQQLRFENEVEFTLQIDENIDLFSTLIPPMLVQPFVENAFEHGFRNINHTGILTIDYIKEGQRIIIRIQDNGRGFSQQQTAEQSNTHVSQAMRITQERLTLLNKGKSNKVQITVESMPEQGTTISFTIPLITLK